ncbi:MAG: AI-2E family transporter [Solirubrobacterales bacterium]
MEATPWYHPPADQSWDRKMLRTIATVVLAVLSLLLIYKLRTPLLWLTIALFVAIAASGPVNVLGRHMKRGLAIATVYALMVLIPVGIGAILLPPLVKSGVQLVEDLPTYVDDFRNTLQKDPRFEKVDANFNVNEKLSTLAGDLSQQIGTAGTALASIGAGLISSIFAGFTIFILSMFMVARGRGWLDIAIRRRPPPEAEALSRTVDRIGGAVGGYIGGALLQALIAGIFAFIVLSILGVTSPLILAAIVAVFDVIPMVGSTIAGVFVGIVTLFASFPLDTIVWGVFVIGYQQFENYVIQPRIQSRAVELEPFVILVAVLFGGTLMGIVGAILAIPVAATIQITVQEWGQFRKDIADDDQSVGTSSESPAPS